MINMKQLIIILLFPFICNAQTDFKQIERKKDTVMVLMVVSDTTKIYNFYNADGSLFGYKMTEENELPKRGKKVLTGFLLPAPINMYGYSVREIHNEGENSIDWYFDHQRPPKDYPVHIYYLDNKKKPLGKNIIVWQAIETTKQQ